MIPGNPPAFAAESRWVWVSTRVNGDAAGPACRLGHPPRPFKTRLNFGTASPSLPGVADILSVSGLCVSRGRTEILRGVDWRVRRGEHWVILGPNGCGKTSLLKSITGYLSPSSGSIALLGETYGEADWRDLRLKVGIVTSALQASIPAAETALETVVSGRYAQLDLWAHPTRAETAGAARLLRFVGGAHLARREWIHLSQGERQRILIARSLMARPRLLILDEPTEGIQPSIIKDIGRVIEQLVAGGDMAIVLVEQYFEFARDLASAYIVMQRGEVVLSGRASEMDEAEVRTYLTV